MFCKGFLELRERKDEGVSLCQDELITCLWKDCPPWWLLEDSMLSVPFPAMQDIWILCDTFCWCQLWMSAAPCSQMSLEKTSEDVVRFR